VNDEKRKRIEELAAINFQKWELEMEIEGLHEKTIKG